MAKRNMVIAYLKENPSEGTTKIAKKLGVSTRTVRRAKESIRKEQNDSVAPRILIFDIETSPMEVYVWGLFKQRISIDQIIKDWSVLSWSAKWLFDSEVMGERVTIEEAMSRTDASVMEGMWNLFNDADIVVAHNAVKFDVRKLNARFIANGYTTPSPFQIIDTLKVSIRNFAFASHKLDYLTKFFNLEEKLKTEYSLWVRCVTGDDSALDEMFTYNKQDVVALEELYVKLRPWIKSHPNLGLYYDTNETLCPNCGSDRITWGGYYYTPAGKYATFRCGCGAIGRSRYSALSKEKARSLPRSVAR